MNKEQIRTFRVLAAKRGFLHDYEIADALNMTKFTLSRKIHGSLLWTTDDINKAKEAFLLSNRQARELFL